jgi:Coiled-coil domain-containing protein 124 /Oxs1
VAEAKEAAQWDDPGSKKGKGKESAEAKAEKKAEEARKKAEREKLLAEEEASIPDGGKKGAAKKAEKAAGGGNKKQSSFVPSGIDDAITSLSASNIDDALDALSIANEKTDTASQGSKAAQLERHPERRFKAAFEAFKEREMTRIKQERPGMRSQQYHDALYKEFQKHPDNPFNQLTVAYDATKDEKLSALQSKRDATARRLAGE